MQTRSPSPSVRPLAPVRRRWLLCVRIGLGFGGDPRQRLPHPELPSGAETPSKQTPGTGGGERRGGKQSRPGRGGAREGRGHREVLGSRPLLPKPCLLYGPFSLSPAPCHSSADSFLCSSLRYLLCCRHSGETLEATVQRGVRVNQLTVARARQWPRVSPRVPHGDLTSTGGSEGFPEGESPQLRCPPGLRGAR